MLVVVVLAGVDEDLVVARPQDRRQGRRLDQLRPRADDAERFAPAKPTCPARRGMPIPRYVTPAGSTRSRMRIATVQDDGELREPGRVQRREDADRPSG